MTAVSIIVDASEKIVNTYPRVCVMSDLLVWVRCH
jgi:hypothetical protein